MKELTLFIAGWSSLNVQIVYEKQEINFQISASLLLDSNNPDQSMIGGGISKKLTPEEFLNYTRGSFKIKWNYSPAENYKSLYKFIKNKLFREKPRQMIKFWKQSLLIFFKNSPEVSQEEFEEKSNNELLETAKELIFFKLQNEKFVKFNEKNLKYFFEKIYESYEAENQCDSSSFSTDSDETYYSNDEDSDQSVSTGFKKDFSYFL